MIRRDHDAVPDCRLPGDEPKPVCMTGKVLVEFDVSFVVTIDEDDECTDEQAMLDAAYEHCINRISDTDYAVSVIPQIKECFPKLE